MCVVLCVTITGWECGLETRIAADKSFTGLEVVKIKWSPNLIVEISFLGLKMSLIRRHLGRGRLSVARR